MWRFTDLSTSEDYRRLLIKEIGQAAVYYCIPKGFNHFIMRTSQGAYERISITVNGEKYDEHVPHGMLLVDFLRDQLGLTGTHVGCTHEGVCGACTVHLNGRP